MNTLITILSFVVFINANAQYINTLAGTGLTGYSGDGGLALRAKLNSPCKICADATGVVYFADNYNHCVRKIDATGIITTIAGTGTAGFSGDGGLAVSAELNSPIGVNIDAIGNIYITDSGNHRIRKINTNGIINTVVGSGPTGTVGGGYSGDGGQATSATLYSPTNIVINAAGNMFIADGENNRIRKVDVNGIITTVAGSGATGYGNGSYSGDGGQATSATMSYPFDLALDGAGNLYIADYLNNRIRKVDQNGIISTIAGTGSANYSGDGGPATSAEIDGPGDVDIDEAGNIYIAQSNECCIRKIDANGIITTIAGNGIPGHTGDGGLATSANLGFPVGMEYKNGIIYITEFMGNSVRMICGSAVNNFTSTNICAGEAATLTIGGASTYMWNTLETEPSIVVSPTVTTKYYAQGRDDDGCVHNNGINVIVSPCLGIEESLSNNNHQFKIYPNPASQIINVELGMMNENLFASFIDIYGREVKRAEIQKEIESINVEDLPAGIYFITLMQSGKVLARQKVVIMD